MTNDDNERERERKREREREREREKGEREGGCGGGGERASRDSRDDASTHGAQRTIVLEEERASTAQLVPARQQRCRLPGKVLKSTLFTQKCALAIHKQHISNTLAAH